MKEGISNKSGKVEFWSSTEYSGFLAGLIRELSEAGFDAKQCYQISEASYRSAKSAPARLFLRFRQYVAYPVQLIAALGMQRVRRLCRVTAATPSESPSPSGAPSASDTAAPSDSGSVGKHSTINDQPSTS